MTVPSTTRRAGPFTGTGALVAYPFTFKVFAKQDLAVTIADSNGLETDLVLDSTFTVTLNVDQEATPGGTVNYAVGGVATALPSGYTLVVTGDGLEFEQTADLPQGGNFSPVVIENALDRIVMLLQRLWDGVRRSMRLPDTASDNVSTVLPVPTANNFIGWDSNATALRNVDPNTLATVVAFAAWQSQAFSGDGVTTQFTLSSDPGNVNNLDVVVGAVPQRNNVDFTLSGTTLTFDVAPANGLSIFCRWGQALPEGTSTLQARLADPTSASNGPALIAFDGTVAYATGIGAILYTNYGRTAKEISAGVTPTNYSYPPLNALRYGADNTGVASSTTAFANMMLSVPTTGGECVIPPGTYKGKLVINRNYTTVNAKGAKIVAESSSECVLMQLSGGILVGSHLYHAQIDGNGGTYTAKGVNVVRAVDCVVEWCIINECKDDGIKVTGDGVGACTHVVLKHNRINAHASRSSGAYGINIGGGGVNAATRLYDNYVAGYDTTVNDAGVNTVDLGGIGETGTSYVVTSGGDGVYFGNWIESGSYTGSHYVISDSRTSIYSPHDSGIANVATGTVGQFPAKANRIIMKDGSVLGAVIMPDTGPRHYNTAAGGTLIADSPANMRGSFQIAGAATTATITFSRTEANTSYFVSITATAKTGAPAAGANRVVSVAKATTGFTVTVEAAPGGATDVSFDWIIVR